MAKKKANKQTTTALVEYEPVIFNPDELTPEEKEALVKQYATHGASAEFIARKLKMELSDFNDAYKIIMSDAIEEMGLDLVAAMKTKAFNSKAQVDAKSAAYLLERFVDGPKETRYVGAKNQTRPIPSDGERQGIPTPKFSDAMVMEMEKEKEKA